MAALGWKEGTNYVLEERWADGHADRLPSLATELTAKNPATIVSAAGRATIAATKAAPAIPVVQADGPSPVAVGLAKSLARPGRMVTGRTNISTEVAEKYLEFLLAAVPRLKRIGFLIDSTSANYAVHVKTARRSAEQHRIEVRFAEAAKAEELEAAVSRLRKDGVQGLVVLPSSWFTAERTLIIKLALAHRWPVVAGPLSFATDGALLAYSHDVLASFRRAAYYVDRILKGAKPGDLPIEQPTKFELAISMKTAKALGLTIPQELLLRADKVIE